MLPCLDGAWMDKYSLVFSMLSSCYMPPRFSPWKIDPFFTPTMLESVILLLIPMLSIILASPVNDIETGNHTNATDVSTFRHASCRPVFPPYYRVVNPYTFCRSPIDKILSSRPGEVIELAKLTNQGKWTSKRGECYLLWAAVGPTADHARVTRYSLGQAAQHLKRQCFPYWNAPTAIQEGWIVRAISRKYRQ